MFVQANDGPMFLCHEEGEFFYTEPIDISEPIVNFNVVINLLDNDDVIWLGFFAPQGDDGVTINCKVSDMTVGIFTPGITPAPTTTDLEVATIDAEKEDGELHGDIEGVYIGIGVGVGLLVICIPVVLVLIFRRRLVLLLFKSILCRYFKSLDGWATSITN
ncbi:hypothetical protein LOTGIDRAFT_162774 [Lottia gigantea]|uniref:Uncharacterized protein n=1 Tax=Lottia gigantea TaxID=225164 RepID=V3ZL82_LOTGI|nr:hypothetical protein LOTGIDRAFT_162774 [Lottia gigantea]ESO92123.1 hypothetical protein LOTGIDRAFT_162774 [Lottia gigantea]